MLGGSSLCAQGTPAGSHIRNWATLAYTSSGFGYVIPSDTVDLVVAQVAGVQFQSPQSTGGAPGATVVFAHTLTNRGNAADSFSVAAASGHGWTVTLYRDWNANGVLDAGDSVISRPVALPSGASASLLVQVAIPGAGSGGVTDTITATATSRFDPSVASSLRDVLAVSSAAIAFSLTKQVDRATASGGDVLTYTLNYAVSGSDSATMVQLADTVPNGVSYVPGSMRWNGTALTDAADGDAGRFVVLGNGVVAASLGTIHPGMSGSVTFQARVNAVGPPPTVTNRGNVAFVWTSGADTTISNAVLTTVLAPALSLAKQLTTPVSAVAPIGQPVVYHLRYGNASGAGIAQNVALTDTIPAGLQYVSAAPAPAVAGQVLTWSLGTLAAADTGGVDLVLAVAPTVRDTQRVVNTAYLQGQGTPALAAAATQVALVGPPTAALGLDLTADALEAGVGEAIPYTIVVRNPGTLVVTDMQVTVRLPSGARYVPASAIAADSTALSPGRLILYTAAPLAPGASRTLRYVAALVSAPGTVAEARAIATGHVTGGLAASPEAIAWVQIRRAWPMETRAAIGKVWVDVNGDGIQDDDEPGLANVDVWTEDGMIATTDATGKFSFLNVRPGRHAFRLDPRSIPDGYAVAGDGIQFVDASGWTTPQVDFRVRATRPLAAEPPRGAPATPEAPMDRGEQSLAPSRRSAGVPVAFTFGAVRLHAPPDTQGLSRDHVLPATYRSQARYEMAVRQPREFTIDALVVFSPRADSAVVYVDGRLFTRYSWLDEAIPIPLAHPDAQIRIVAWSSVRSDSAAVRVVAWPPEDGQITMARRLWGRVESTASTAVRDSLVPLTAMMSVPPTSTARSASAAAAGSASGTPGDATPTVPFDSAADPVADPVRVPGARPRVHGQSAARLDAVIRGPGIEIFSPKDGTVLPSDHIYVGVKGEPNESVVLYDGATRIDSARTRIDGVLDFIAVPLTSGPHRLRVAMTNSWGHERWDSIAIHVTGLPARFDLPANRLQLVADGRTSVTLAVRVLDSWGVPVAQPAYVTVSAKGATPLGTDADPSSVGLQLLSTARGRLTIALRPGRVVGDGEVELKSGAATATVPLDVLPEVRGLTVAGSGMVGVGASPEAYGAATARGRLDAQTSFTLGLDSRRLNDGRPDFARSADPLEESQYPILGDASEQQKRTASQTWLSARLERGYDWAAFGDLSTVGFTSGLSLARYQRAVTGVAAQVSTGAVTWSGFGSMTSQALQQVQIRGAGVSGPYQVAPGILPGTEYLRVETRDLVNPERAVATQALVRFVDYQIDYTAGVVLFKQPIPATDANGNPVFILVSFEAASGGDQKLVAGGRAALDVRRLAGGMGVDSLRLGITAVSAEQSVNRYRLLGGDVRALRVGALDVAAEVAYAEQGDSTGVAAAAKGSYRAFGGALTLGAGYMRVGREFTNPANVALRPGLTELTVKGGLKVGATELQVEHAEERFELQGVDREHNHVGLRQSVAPGLQVEAGVVNDRLDGGAAPSEATAAEVKTKWGPSPRLQFWTEARHHLSLYGPELSPDVWGFGGSYRLTSTLALEASQRYISRSDSQHVYALSSLGVRADVAPGTQAYGSYQLTGGVGGPSNAAVVGLRNRLQLAPGFAVNVLFERRVGVSSAAVSDPVRALPFLQPEEDYWSAGAGVELVPQGAPYRLSARAEYKDGSLQSSRLASVAGDVAFDASLALLSRQEFSQQMRPGAPLARRLSSLWGLAFRPAHSDRVNMLAKVQWNDDRNPIGGGVLVPTGSERKLIGAAEMIWTPAPSVELGTRYAMRRTVADRVYADGTPQTLTAWADYIGSRMSVDLNRWLSVRGDGRLLVERTTGATSWDGAPTVALRPVNGLELATGYRFGNLNDPDFSVRGGHGMFVTLSAALTEKAFPTAAAFWRPRF